jgi:hypothetical protein
VLQYLETFLYYVLLVSGSETNLDKIHETYKKCLVFREQDSIRNIIVNNNRITGNQIGYNATNLKEKHVYEKQL